MDREGKETSIGGEPVTEWLQVAAFDTAERCERARLEGHQQLAAAAKKKPTAAEMHTKTLTGIQLPPPTPAQGRAMRELILMVLPAFVWVRSLPPWGMVDRSPLPCDANYVNAQKNGSARAAASRAAADLVAEPPQLLPTRDPEERY